MIGKRKNDYHASLLLRTTKLALSCSVSLLCGSNCCCCCLGGGDEGAPISNIKMTEFQFNKINLFELVLMEADELQHLTEPVRQTAVD